MRPLSATGAGIVNLVAINARKDITKFTIDKNECAWKMNIQWQADGGWAVKLNKGKYFLIVRFFKSTIISMAIFLVFSHWTIAASQETSEQNKKKKQIATEKAPLIPNVPVDSGNFTTEDRSREEVKYVNGKREGKTVIWFNDGGRIDGEYIGGLKNGIWIHHDKAGKKIWQESYSKSI